MPQKTSTNELVETFCGKLSGRRGRTGQRQKSLDNWAVGPGHCQVAAPPFPAVPRQPAARSKCPATDARDGEYPPPKRSGGWGGRRNPLFQSAWAPWRCPSAPRPSPARAKSCTWAFVLRDSEGSQPTTQGKRCVQPPPGGKDPGWLLETRGWNEPPSPMFEQRPLLFCNWSRLLDALLFCLKGAK